MGETSPASTASFKATLRSLLSSSFRICRRDSSDSRASGTRQGRITWKARSKTSPTQSKVEPNTANHPPNSNTPSDRRFK
jgi:hypothetical protein